MNSNTISEFKNRLENLKGIFEIDNKIEKIKSLDLVSSDENFWNDQEKAQKILKKQGELKSLVNSFKKLNKEGLILSEKSSIMIFFLASVSKTGEENAFPNSGASFINAKSSLTSETISSVWSFSLTT